MKALYSVTSKEVYCLLVVPTKDGRTLITPEEVGMPLNATCHYLCTVPDAVPCGVLGKWITAEYKFPWDWVDPEFKFAARDKDNTWFIYTEMPSKQGRNATWTSNITTNSRQVNLYNFSHPLDKVIPWNESLICRESSK